MRPPRGGLAKPRSRLAAAGLLERVVTGDRQTGYHLTAAGEATRSIVKALIIWGADRALEQTMPAELDPVMLMWWLRRRVRRQALPHERVVVQFDFHGKARSFWLVMETRDVSVCFTQPDYEVDMWGTADLSVFYQVWLGRLPFVATVEEGSVEVRSLPALEHAFPDWFAWSPVVEVLRNRPAPLAADPRQPTAGPLCLVRADRSYRKDSCDLRNRLALVRGSGDNEIFSPLVGFS